MNRALSGLASAVVASLLVTASALAQPQPDPPTPAPAEAPAGAYGGPEAQAPNAAPAQGPAAAPAQQAPAGAYGGPGSQSPGGPGSAPNAPTAHAPAPHRAPLGSPSTVPPPMPEEPPYDPGLALSPPPPPPMRIKHYGLQIMLVDAAWIALAASSDNNEGLATAAGLLYLGGGSIVHMSHGNNSSAVLSAGLRAGLPLAGALLGAGTVGGDDSLDTLAGVAVGGFLGGATAMVLDWFILGRQEIPIETTPRRHYRSRSFSIAPDVGIGHESMRVGVQGAF